MHISKQQEREHSKRVHNWRELDDSVSKYDRAAYLKLRSYVPALVPPDLALWRWERRVLGGVIDRLAFQSYGDERLFGHIENHGSDLRYAFLSIPFRWPEAAGEPDGAYADAVKRDAYRSAVTTKQEYDDMDNRDGGRSIPMQQLDDGKWVVERDNSSGYWVAKCGDYACYISREFVEDFSLTWHEAMNAVLDHVRPDFKWRLLALPKEVVDA